MNSADCLLGKMKNERFMGPQGALVLQTSRSCPSGICKDVENSFRRASQESRSRRHIDPFRDALGSPRHDRGGIGSPKGSTPPRRPDLHVSWFMSEKPQN